MKKFIVTFTYKGFLFHAKVLIRKQNNAIIYSTKLVEDCLGYLFNNKELIFAKEENGYQLVLFSGATRQQNQTYIPLDWHIKNEYVDQEDSLHLNSFSMS